MYCSEQQYNSTACYMIVKDFLQLYVAVSDVVSMDGAQALQGGGGERDAWRATDVLHPLHLADAPLEHTAETPQLISSM